MENYEKGEVVEVEEPPVFTLADNDVHMKVSGGSKIRNVMGYAMKKIKEPEVRQICWAGSGKAITKTVSCAEIMKRKIKGLHQITKIRYRRVEEYWEPKIEGLERLKVNRDIPAIAILLSKDPLDKNEPGYQGPGSFKEFWSDVVDQDRKIPKNTKSDNRPKKRPHVNNRNSERKVQNEKKVKDVKETGKNRSGKVRTENMQNKSVETGS